MKAYVPGWVSSLSSATQALVLGYFPSALSWSPWAYRAPLLSHAVFQELYEDLRPLKSGYPYGGVRMGLCKIWGMGRSLFSWKIQQE